MEEETTQIPLIQVRGYANLASQATIILGDREKAERLLTRLKENGLELATTTPDTLVIAFRKTQQVGDTEEKANMELYPRAGELTCITLTACRVSFMTGNIYEVPLHRSKSEPEEYVNIRICGE